MGCSSSVSRTPDPQSRKQILCCIVKEFYIALVHPSMQKYLAVDSSGYLSTNSRHALIAACLNASQRSQDVF